MPIDPYSLCPGGSGEKIKFCCSDLLGELQKIERMIEGEQYQACLSHIDRLRRDKPDRACLLAVRGMLLRISGQLEPALENAVEFVEKHPDNAIALAELTIVTAASEGGRAAIGVLFRALAASDKGVQTPVYEALGTVAEVLLSEGEWVAGRALLQLQMSVGGDDVQPVQLMIQLNRSSSVPLLLKDDPLMSPCPDGAPFAERFERAIGKTHKGDWQGAVEAFAALAADFDGVPAIWRNLSLLRGWLADRPGQIEALRRFAALDVPLEDAVEAETLAMLCEEDSLGDLLDVFHLTWTIENPEEFQAAVELNPRAARIPMDAPAGADEDSPPPRGAYLLLDQAAPADSQPPDIKAVSRILGRAMLFGRQTDREARLEVVGVCSADLPQLRTLLGEIGGNALEGEPQQELMARVSASRQLFQLDWRPPPGASPEQLDSLTTEHLREAAMIRWPELKLGVLDGKSPREAAGDESFRTRLPAAILVLQSWLEDRPAVVDFNQLRRELGLPALEPIDPAQLAIDRLPLLRLERVVVERTSDEQLVYGFRRAVAFNATGALAKFAQALIERTTLPPGEEQVRAYRILAQMTPDPDRSLQYIEQGYQFAQQANLSDALLHLAELPLRAFRGEGARAGSLVQHLQSGHIEEPGVAQALTQFLVQVGAIHPDGTPAAVPAHAREATVGPGGAEAPGAPDAETGKIWTPGSDQGGGGEKKLWTPD